MIEETIFYSRLKQEIKKSRKSTNQIERELGYSRNTLNNYKNGTEPSGARLIEIAEYFHVSPNFLIGKIDISSENSTIILFEQLNDAQKLEILKLCYNWSENLIKNTQLPKKFDACIMLSENTVVFSKSLSNDLVGASEIKSQVLELNDTYAFKRIVIGMEATSLYSFHPAMFFNDDDDDDNDLKLLHTEVMIEQPHKIKRYREAFEENKNDMLDVFYIADYFRIERFTPSILKEEKYLALQYLIRMRLQLIEQLVRTKQHFTENIYYKCNTLSSELSTSVYSATLITLMTENYTLDDLAETPIEEFSGLIQSSVMVASKHLTSLLN